MNMSRGLCEELSFAHMQASNRGDRTAVEFLLTCAEENPLALSFTSLLYYYGLTVPEDEDKAADIAGRCKPWLESIVAKCIDSTPTNLHDPAYPYVLYILALYLYWGIGVDRDWPRHYLLLKTGEQFGYPPLLCSLGYCYKDGEGTEINSKEAVRLFRCSANAGSASGMKNLGDCYKDGFGVNKDINEALRQYRKASYLGLDIAMQALGEVYYRGVELPEDSVTAFKWFKLGAEKGDTHSEYTLGWYHENGVGMPISYSLALDWYRKAAAKRHLSSKVAAAELLYQISDVQNNGYEEAVYYANLAIHEFKKSKPQEYTKPPDVIAKAYFLLARAHLIGRGCSRNEPKALAYLHEALTIKHDFVISLPIIEQFAGSICKHNYIPLIKYFLTQRHPAATSMYEGDFRLFLQKSHDIANCVQVMAELGMPLSLQDLNFNWRCHPFEVYGELDVFLLAGLTSCDNLVPLTIQLISNHDKPPSLRNFQSCFEQGLLTGIEDKSCFATPQRFWKEMLPTDYNEEGEEKVEVKIEEWHVDVYSSLLEWDGEANKL